VSVCEEPGTFYRKPPYRRPLRCALSRPRTAEGYFGICFPNFGPAWSDIVPRCAFPLSQICQTV